MMGIPMGTMDEYEILDEFEEAQEMDITPLTLPTFFDSIVSKALNQ